MIRLVSDVEDVVVARFEEGHFAQMGLCFLRCCVVRPRTGVGRRFRLVRGRFRCLPEQRKHVLAVGKSHLLGLVSFQGSLRGAREGRVP